jgi:hypothetical protein
VIINSSFAHAWRAEVLPGRPLILPRRQFVYPAQVDEVERGALEVLVTPPSRAGSGTTAPNREAAEPFLATCALGFAGAVTGVWACPDPGWMCAVAGGYAYLINTVDPQQWARIEYLPVTEIRPLPEQKLLLFAGFHSLLAWGGGGKAWQTARLTWEGLTITGIRGNTLFGLGWDMHSDRELEFEVDLTTGEHHGGGFTS